MIRAAFAALHPNRTGLLAKAALRSKGGREPGATRTCCVRNHSGAGATPAPSTKTPHDDALTEQACRQYRGLGTAQEPCELALASVGEEARNLNGFKAALQHCFNTYGVIAPHSAVMPAHSRPKDGYGRAKRRRPADSYTELLSTIQVN